MTKHSGHDHGVDQLDHDTAEIQNKLKRRAVQETNRSVQSVYEDTVTDYVANGAVAGTLPTFNGVRSSMYRKRRQEQPPLPRTREEVDIPDRLRQLDGENLLLVDDGDMEKILIFSTRQNLNLLAEADTLYGDGTFYAEPRV